MKDIEPASSFGPMLDEDVRNTLTGLRRWERYAASDLYDRYAEMVRADNRTPGHVVAFGQTLRRLGCTRSKMTVGGAGRGNGKGRGRQIVAWTVV